MMNTLDEALSVRNEDTALTDWRYHDIMGAYCRFGSLPISLYQSDRFGGLYMTDIKSTKPTSVTGAKMPTMNPTYWSTVRVPVGFEVLPGKFPGFSVLAQLMHMPIDVVQAAYERVLHHGFGTCSFEWSMNCVS